MSIRPGWSLRLEEAATAPEAPTVSAMVPKAPTIDDVVTVSGKAEGAGTGWSSLDVLLNWGPLGSLTGSLTGDSGSSGDGSSGSADGAEFGSATGSMSEGSLGEAGSTSFIEGPIGGGTVTSGPGEPGA